MGAVADYLTLPNTIAIVAGWVVIYLTRKKLQRRKALEGMCFNLIDQLETQKLYKHELKIYGNQSFLADVNRINRCISNTVDKLQVEIKKEKELPEKISKSCVKIRQTYSLDPRLSDSDRVMKANIEISNLQGLIYLYLLATIE